MWKSINVYLFLKQVDTDLIVSDEGRAINLVYALIVLESANVADV